MNFGRPSCLAALALLGASACIPPKLTARDGGADARGEAAFEAAREAPSEAPADTRVIDMRVMETLTVRLENDEDDAVWIDGTDERLHYSDENPTIEVGTDNEKGRVGLRFALDVPRGMRIVSASLRLRQHDGAFSLPSVTIAIQVYDSVNVAPFDEAHAHSPENHDPRHLWGSTVTGLMTANDGDALTSPDIAKLVQRIVDRAEWSGSGHIGFVLSPDQDGFPSPGWVSFDDASLAGGDPASLVVTYASP